MIFSDASTLRIRRSNDNAKGIVMFHCINLLSVFKFQKMLPGLQAPMTHCRSLLLIRTGLRDQFTFLEIVIVLLFVKAILVLMVDSKLLFYAFIRGNC